MQDIRCNAVLVLVSGLVVINVEVTKTACSFCLFWLGIVFGDMALFVTVVTADLAKKILFCTSGRFGIIFDSWDTIFLILSFVTPLLIRFLLFFCPGLVGGLNLLLSHDGLTLVLWGYARLLGFFKLIARVDTHVQVSLSLGTLLVHVGIPIDTGFGFGPIGFANKVVSGRRLLTYFSNP